MKIYFSLFVVLFYFSQITVSQSKVVFGQNLQNADTVITSFDSMPIGFASLNILAQNGTTGGAGGDTIVITNKPQLDIDLALRIKTNPKPVVYIIKGTINGTGQVSCKNVSNITFLGESAEAKFNGVGLAITNAANVIVRNIEFGNSKPDCITINTTSSSSTHHIWIDHCTFSDSPEIDPGGTDHGGTHDGLLDISHRSNYITISWCHFYNHNKTALLGYSDNSTDEQGNLKTTYHHNWFDNTTQRNPRVRWAECHVFNNYYDGTKGGSGMGSDGYGISSTMEADVFVEANFFQNVKDPTHIGEGSSAPGDLVSKNNITSDSGPILTRGSAFDPGIYYQYKPDIPTSVPAYVKKYAGSGKISASITSVENDIVKMIPSEINLHQNFPNPFNPSTTIKYDISKSGWVRINIYDVLGHLLKELVNGEKVAGQYSVYWDGTDSNGNTISSGSYFYQILSANKRQSKKMIFLK